MKSIQSSRARFQVDLDGGKIIAGSFLTKKGWVAPHAKAPWLKQARRKSLMPLFQELQGDFFCMPYGWNSSSYKKESFPLHGETSQKRWKQKRVIAEGSRRGVELELPLKIRKGNIVKRLELCEDHTAIYQTIQISGMRGPMTWGTHPMLQFTGKEQGLVSSSPFRYAQTFPGLFMDPAQRGYSSLAPDHVFSKLEKVKTQHGKDADLSIYPNREGFDDMVILGCDPRLPFCWTCVVFPESRFLWYSLKRPDQFSMTILWMANGGMHMAPWSGDFRGVLAVEEVTGMPQGIAESCQKNVFSKRGIQTFHDIKAGEMVELRHIQGVASIPKGFSKVKAVHWSGGRIQFQDESGRKAVEGLSENFLVGF